MTSTDSAATASGRSLRWAMALGVVLIVILILVVVVQGRRLAEFETEAGPENSMSAGASQAPAGRRRSADDVLRERQEALESETPAERGQRMFEELQTVVSDPQIVAQLLQKLVEEGRALRALEQQRDEGLITEAAFAEASFQLTQASEALAESLLTRRQFDRYREVRQSWKRGRIHPDRDSLL